jgi:hypothetical protein
MRLDELMTLAFWNHLARAHLTELIMILTAAVVALIDRYVRRAVASKTSSMHAVFRFLVFLLTCTVGYAALALGVAWGLRNGLVLSHGEYMAPAVLGILVIVAIEAQRQKAA